MSEAEVVEALEAEGLKLVLSSTNETGFKGVAQKRSVSGRFTAMQAG